VVGATLKPDLTVWHCGGDVMGAASGDPGHAARAADRWARNVFEFSIDLSKLIQTSGFKNRKCCLPCLQKL
jgi:hypothetical protein